MKELLIRGISGIVFLALVFVPIWLDMLHLWNTFAFVLYFFSLIGAIELQRMKSKKVLAGAVICTLAFLPVIASSVFSIVYPDTIPLLAGLPVMDIVMTLLIIWIICLIVFIYSVFDENLAAALLKHAWITSLFYPVLPFLLLALTLQVSPQESRVYLILILLPIYINDTFAYATGRLFGKRKMFPVVSPKKTWEGFIGGVAGAQVAMHIIVWSVFGFYSTPMAVAVTLFSLAASVLATFGDLFESKLKRTSGIKDSGKLIPGHGGILDRVDAMLFVAPLLYVLLAFFLQI